MSRLRQELVDRCESFSDRMLELSFALPRGRCPAFVRDQVARSGTSVGANVCEASEALSAKDFVKAMGIALKELAECRFWMRRVERHEWVKGARLVGLHAEAEELARIVATMLIRTRKKLNLDE